jgi:drug/metabolite transporter (DMT)-like permease
MALFFTAYYRPRFRQISAPHWGIIILSGAIGALLMVTRFYAFESLGIIHTTIIAVLAPIIVFLASWEILHERIKTRVLFASIVILIAVTLASLSVPK